MSDKEKIAALEAQAEELKQKMIKAGYLSPDDDPEEPTALDNLDSPDLDLEAELEKAKDAIRQFSKTIK